MFSSDKKHNRKAVDIINNRHNENLKALPSIIESDSKFIEPFSKTHRFKSFDRSDSNKPLDQIVARINAQEKTLKNEGYRNFQNRSVDQADVLHNEGVRHSNFDPLSTLVKLTFNVKNVKGGGVPRLEPISCPISPSPTNREHWPRTVKNSKEIINDFSVSPKSLIAKYESQRKNKVLSVNKLASKHKPLSVWDAMSLYDLENFKKETLINEINRKEQQKQLKKFYDKQVKDKQEKANYEVLRASHEHLGLLSECRSLDYTEHDKIMTNKSHLREMVDTNTIQAHTKRNLMLKELQSKAVEKAKVNAQLQLLQKFDEKVRNQLKSNILNIAEEIKSQKLKNEKAKELERKAKLVEENHALESNIQHLNKMERRYRHIFEVIDQKHSAVQQNYQKLGFGKNNFANFEKDKDRLIDIFANKQITQHEQKMQEENERRRNRRLEMLREMQQANTAQIKHTLYKKVVKKNEQETNEKLMIMKDLASKHMEMEDEIERAKLKKMYLKQNLDLQNTQNLLSKRKDFVLNEKELGINHTIIHQMNRSNYNLKDDIQEDLIQRSYQKSFL